MSRDKLSSITKVLENARYRS